MYCPSCGAENVDRGKFCTVCGTQLIDGTKVIAGVGPSSSLDSEEEKEQTRNIDRLEPLEDATRPRNPTTNAAKQRNGKRGLIIGTAIASAAVLSIGVGAFFLTQNSKNDSSNSQAIISSTKGQGIKSTAGSTEYVLSFDAGGASTGNMAPLICNVGEEVIIPKCGFSYPGRSFAEWNDNKGQSFQPGDKIAISGDTTLTAIWSAEKYTVKFLGAGADGGNVGSISADFGSTVVLPKCSFYRNGYDFDCWVDESGSSFEPGDSASISGDMTFVAQWKSRQQDAPRQNTRQTESSTTQTAINANNLPRSWRGTYEGYTTHTSEGVIERSVTISLSQVGSDGSLEGMCYVGVDEKIAGATHGSYKVKGNIDWQSGQIHLYGTEWVDQGGLIGMGGFRGTVTTDSWAINGQWYDPEGEAQNGDWHMRPQ